MRCFQQLRDRADGSGSAGRHHRQFHRLGGRGDPAEPGAHLAEHGGQLVGPRRGTGGGVRGGGGAGGGGLGAGA
ncbi:hypothetical protein, partial [Nocardia abscessus]|uniref:hypothetical protein n=1 Tax=Nocardia abscessus TaxID=120957 RepID=UPI002454EA92